jgi:hypothetical protein
MRSFVQRRCEGCAGFGDTVERLADTLEQTGIDSSARS